MAATWEAGREISIAVLRLSIGQRVGNYPLLGLVARADRHGGAFVLDDCDLGAMRGTRKRGDELQSH